LALAFAAAVFTGELKKRGFSFIGPTIVYAYLQSAELVNDHLTDCFRHPDFTG
jgi:DNA-3-methyladenine glycosylase I